MLDNQVRSYLPTHPLLSASTELPYGGALLWSVRYYASVWRNAGCGTELVYGVRY